MKRRLSRIRGTDVVVSPAVSAPALRIKDYTLSDTVIGGIRIGCPFCENLQHFEQYAHETDPEKQFFRCLTCLGTFDFSIIEVNRPRIPPPPRARRPRTTRRPRTR